MKLAKKQIAVFGFFWISRLVFAQETDNLSLSLQRNFTRGSLTSKLAILYEAQSREKGVEEDFTPLFLQAIDFIRLNISTLGYDELTEEFVLLAVRLVAAHNLNQATTGLWEIFINYQSEKVQTETLRAIGVVARGDPEIAVRLNRWVAAANEQFLMKKSANSELFREAMSVLGKVGDPSSFLVLFQTSTLDYDASIVEEAQKSLNYLRGNFYTIVIGIIEGDSLSNQITALSYTLNSLTMSAEIKGRIAQKALEKTLESQPKNLWEQEETQKARLIAVEIIATIRYTQAVDLVNRHFNLAIVEQRNALADKNYLIKSINFLGNLAVREATERLTRYLEVLNLDKEKGQPVDDDVALAVIVNLGKLGDSIAFDFLLATRYLDYSDQIKEAAREAMNLLSGS